VSESQLGGYVDECTWEVMRGWARRPDRPNERVTLETLVDGQVVATIVANLPGTDLAEAGIGDGQFRFFIDLTKFEAMCIGDIHDVQVRCADNHTALPPIRLTRWSAGALDGISLIDVLAARYLHGTGLEIGALHRPQALPVGASVRHVDRLSTSQLQVLYAEVPPADIVNVEVIDDGATLATVTDDSVDFLIANNVLEHVEDPISTLANWHRVVKPGGILLLAIPNPRESCDMLRSRTTADHMIRDHNDGPMSSRAEHYREWVVGVERRPADEVNMRALQLMEEEYPIHFHVWDELGCAILVDSTTKLTERKFVVEHLALVPKRIETLLVLRVE
jgi:predicted SAM-dependent methyltransferase